MMGYLLLGGAIGFVAGAAVMLLFVVVVDRTARILPW